MAKDCKHEYKTGMKHFPMLWKAPSA